MKKTTLYFTGFCVLFALLFTACSKDSATNPDTDDTENPTNTITAEQLQESIVGKWTIEGNGLNIVASSIKPRLTALAHNRLTSNIIAGTNGTAATSAFIEFLEDGTFIILDSNGNVSTGDYTAKDGQTIDLSGFGSIKDIKFADGNINCVIHYTQSGAAKTLTIKAKKATQIAANKHNALLCRQWEVIRMEDNWPVDDNKMQQVVWENGVWTGADTEDYDEFNRLLVLFSHSGTYFVQRLGKQGEITDAFVSSWKWHTQDSDTIIYWHKEDEEPEGNTVSDEISEWPVILTLTSTELTMQERYSYEYFSDGEYKTGIGNTITFLKALK